MGAPQRPFLITSEKREMFRQNTRTQKEETKRRTRRKREEERTGQKRDLCPVILLCRCPSCLLSSAFLSKTRYTRKRSALPCPPPRRAAAPQGRGLAPRAFSRLLQCAWHCAQNILLSAKAGVLQAPEQRSRACGLCNDEFF